MTYIAIDGDDIGRRITRFYLANDAASLSSFAKQVQEKVFQLSDLLKGSGYTVIFCAADGVVAQTEIAGQDTITLYRAIEAIGGADLTFSAGIGNTLREAYVALLSAKSTGKARLCIYEDMD